MVPRRVVSASTIAVILALVAACATKPTPTPAPQAESQGIIDYGKIFEVNSNTNIKPAGVALDPTTGDTFVSDTAGSLIYRHSQQTNQYTLLAGIRGSAGYSAGANNNPLTAELKDPVGLAFLPPSGTNPGKLYIADTGNRRVRLVTLGTPPQIFDVAGNGDTPGFFAGNGDGRPPQDARFETPVAVAAINATRFDNGYLFIADPKANNVRVVTSPPTLAAGTDLRISTLPKANKEPLALKNPSGLATDSNGSLYISDTDNRQILRVRKGQGNFDPPDEVIPYARAEIRGALQQAPFTLDLESPTDLATDQADNLYLVDRPKHTVQMLNSSNHRVINIAGVAPGQANSGCQPSANSSCVALNTDLGQISGLAADNRGNVFLSSLTDRDRFDHVQGPGIISAMSGPGPNAAPLPFAWPSSSDTDAASNTYVTNRQNDTIVKVTPGGVQTVIAGTAGVKCPLATSPCGDGGPATAAQLNAPWGIEVDPAGRIFFSDSRNNRIRMFTEGGNITTVAGTGHAEPRNSSQQLPANQTNLHQPSGLGLDRNGDVYVADRLHHQIIRFSVDAAGTPSNVITLAGDGTPGYDDGGGTATQARLNHPLGLAVMRDGTIFLADSYNHLIRKVTPDDRIENWAGNPAGLPPDASALPFNRNNLGGFTGDGGQADQAKLSIPQDVGVDDDGDGDIFIADTLNQRIRYVNHAASAQDRKITTLAGTGNQPPPADAAMPATQIRNNGNPQNASFNYPQDVQVLPDNTLKIADTGNNQIRIIRP